MSRKTTRHGGVDPLPSSCPLEVIVRHQLGCHLAIIKQAAIKDGFGFGGLLMTAKHDVGPARLAGGHGPGGDRDAYPLHCTILSTLIPYILF